MNIIEENKLNEIILNIHSFINQYQDFESFYANIDSLDLGNIQKLSFESDLHFFDDVSFILSVIASIISHPHLANTGEDIIIRSELASSISQESFQKVFKDPSLWKEKDQEMVPEYVHHHQYIDEIKIYENIFIGMIIKAIDNSLNNYSFFYASLLPSINFTTNAKLENQDIEKILIRIDQLKRKIMYLKNTYFFKEISKCDLKLKVVVPTNILVKDRLYNFCYKFYRKFIKYVDQETLENDALDYYFYHLLKVLKQKEFILVKQENECLEFKYQNFKVLLSKKTKNCINISITHHNLITTNHQLLIDVNTNQDLQFNQDATSINIISIWTLKDQNGKALHQDTMSTNDLLRIWLDSKFIQNQVQKSLYTKYCPVCKNRSVNEENDLYICSSCGTTYTFIDDDTIWICKTRSF